MVVRTRLRAILIPLVLYAVSGAVGSYFIWTVRHGERGIEARLAFKTKLRELQSELSDLRADKARWTHRVAMMQPDAIDRDLLDEQARLELGRVNKNDMVILLPQTHN